ncbi:MAG: RluA family pseudouridine synthase [Nitrospirota bacterium]
MERLAESPARDAGVASTIVTVSAGEAPDRIDRFLARQGLPVSRSRVQRGLEEGLIDVNGRRVRPSYLIRPGDRITIRHPPPRPQRLHAEAIPLDVVYEDDDLLVIDKPAGLVVHPAPGHASGTLVNALLHHCRGLAVIGGTERPGIVHRLDKDTSGLLVAAKHDAAHSGLMRQFKSHTIARRYLAIVAGDVRPRKGTVDVAIGRDVWERKKISPRTTSPKRAVSHYEVVERFGHATLVAVTLETGRTHQIRVHMAHRGYPVLGDPVYGGRRALPPPGVSVRRQMLHAQHLGFLHPITGRPLAFSVPLPEDMESVRRELARAAASGAGRARSPRAS